MTLKQACRNQMLLDQKAEADTIHVILDGCVNFDYDKARLVHLDAPLLLGDTAVIQPGCRNIATVKCHTYTTCLSIHVTRLMMLFKEFPEEEKKFRQLSAQNIETLRGMLADSVHKTNISSMVKSRSVVGDIASIDKLSGEGRANVTQGTSGANDAKSFEGAEEEIFKEVLDKYFVGCDPKFCEYLVGGMEKTVYFADQIMLREGDEGDFAIILQRGSAVVEVGGVRVGEVKEGGLIGEAVLLGNAAQRTATVRAVGFVSAFTLDQSVVLAALAEFPEEKERIASTMSLREQANKMLTGAKPGSESQGNDKAVTQRESTMNRKSYHNAAQAFRRTSNQVRSSTTLASEAPVSRRTRGKSIRAQFGESEVSDSILADSLATFHLSEGSGSNTSKRDIESEAPRSTCISFKEPDDDDEEDARSSQLGSSRLSSKGAGGSWSRRRREAMQRAERLHELRSAQVGTGALLPLVPAAVGYRACPKPGTPWSPLPDSDRCAAAAVVPWKMRMQTATKCYKPKVWHEVFG